MKRCLDPQAEFLFVPADKLLETATREQAVPFDVPNAELGHHGRDCCFADLGDRVKVF